MKIETYTIGAAVRIVHQGHALLAAVQQACDLGVHAAARSGARYTGALEASETIIAQNATGDIRERQVKPIFR